MIVVDVNVIAYLLIDGPQTRTAEAVLAVDQEWAAPMLWRSEWRNVLAGYLRRGSMDLATVGRNLSMGAKLIGERERLPDGDRVMQLVATSRCSAYDCEYVAVAESLGVPLVTADRRILGDFPHIARSPEVFTL